MNKSLSRYVFPGVVIPGSIAHDSTVPCTRFKGAICNIHLFRPFTSNIQGLAVMKSATESDISTPRCVFLKLCLFQPVFQFVVNVFFLSPLFRTVHTLHLLNTAVSKQQYKVQELCNFDCKAKWLFLLRYTCVGLSNNCDPWWWNDIMYGPFKHSLGTGRVKFSFCFNKTWRKMEIITGLFPSCASPPLFPLYPYFNAHC